MAHISTISLGLVCNFKIFWNYKFKKMFYLCFNFDLLFRMDFFSSVF